LVTYIYYGFSNSFLSRMSAFFFFFSISSNSVIYTLSLHDALPISQLLWAWARLDEAEASARSGIEVLSSYQPQQQLQCLAMKLRSEEHTSELQSRFDLVCRLLLEKKKIK